MLEGGRPPATPGMGSVERFLFGYAEVLPATVSKSIGDPINWRQYFPTNFLHTFRGQKVRSNPCKSNVKISRTFGDLDGKVFKFRKKGTYLIGIISYITENVAGKHRTQYLRIKTQMFANSVKDTHIRFWDMAVRLFGTVQSHLMQCYICRTPAAYIKGSTNYSSRNTLSSSCCIHRRFN